MARIKDLDVYPLDGSIDLEEYVIGTSPSEDGKTLNYRLSDILVAFREGDPHVSVDNPIAIVYIRGNETTDGSIRLLPDTSTSENVEFQLRTEGVWNDTGIQIAASTIFLGRDLEIQGAGDWISTTDVQLDHLALIPHIEYDDEGTRDAAHIPILKPLVVDFPIQPIFDTEIITSSHIDVQINPLDLLAKDTKMKTGSVAATEPVTIEFSRPTGVVFWKKNLPASQFAAGVDVAIELDGLVEAFAGEIIETRITSAATFSLLGDSSGEAYTLLSFFEISEEDIISSTTGMDRIIFDSLDGHTIADQFGNLILRGESPDSNNITI